MNVRTPTASLVAIALAATVGCHEEQRSRGEVPAASERDHPPASRAFALDTTARVQSSVSSPIDLGAPENAQSPGEKLAPAVAFDGTNYLVVWTDGRMGSEQSIYGTRVTPTGDVLDPYGIRIWRKYLREARDPVVTFDGTNFVVAFTYRNYNNQFSDPKLGVVRVTPNGQALDPGNAIEVSADADTVGGYDIASDGATSLVVWADRRNGSPDVFGARIDANGNILDTRDLSIRVGANVSDSPSVAYDGTNYLVVWHDYEAATDFDVLAVRVARDGTVVESDPIIVTAALQRETQPVAAFDGTNTLVVWERHGAGGWDILARRISPAGAAVDPMPVVVSDAAGDQRQPEVVARGASGWTVGWHDTRAGSEAFYAARVAPSGTVLDPTGVEVDGDADATWGVGLASGGTGYFGAWSSTDEADRTAVFGRRLDDTLALVDPSAIRLALTNHAALDVVLATDGDEFFAVWGDRRGGDLDIWGTRLDATGAVLDPDGIAIAIAAGDQDSPGITHDGTHWVVAWRDDRDDSNDIYASRVDPTGAVLDPDGIAVATGIGDAAFPTLASDGTRTLVAWQRNIGSNADVLAARLAADGTVLDTPPIDVSVGAQAEQRPSVAYDGTDFVVTWTDHRTGDHDIYGARVEPTAGVLLDPAGFPIAADPSVPEVDGYAIGGTGELLVVWQAGSGPDADLYAATVAGAVVSPPTTISTAPAAQYQAAGAFDGLDYLLTWIDARNGKTDLYGARLDASSGVLDADIEIATSDTVRFALDAAAASGRRFLVGAVASDPTDAAIRLPLARLVTFERILTATSLSSRTDEDTPLAIDLREVSSDADIAYTVRSEPTSGTLGGTAPDLVYTPDLDFHGSDAFTVEVSAADAAPQSAVVSIDVSSVDDAPVFVAPTPEDGTSFEIAGGMELSLPMAAFDGDGDELAFTVTPTLDGARLEEARYAWIAAEPGSHALELRVSDGVLSSTRSYSVTVLPDSVSSPDMGTEPDSGPRPDDPDAGPDLGGEEPKVPKVGEDSKGCGCSSSSGTPPFASMMLVVGLLGARRRRRR